MNKVVIVVGFFGEGNLGDEAILDGLMQFIPKETKVFVTSGNFRQKQHENFIPRKGLSAWLAFLKTLTITDHVVLTGGVLQDWTVDGIAFYALRMLAAARFGKSPELWGAGLGPIRNKWATKIVRRCLRLVSVAWLRDAFSAKLFESFTGRSSNLGADWSWAIPVSPQTELSENSNSKIGINIRPWFSSEWLNLTKKLVSEQTKGRSFLGIAARGEDLNLLKCEFPNIERKLFSNFKEILQLGSLLTEGWAMRYHVLLAMLRAGVRVIPLAYDEKVKQLCVEVGINYDFRNDKIVPQIADSYKIRQMQERFFKMKEAFNERFYRN